jgi:hypothetical protein
VLAKGKTQRCERQFGANLNIVVHHPESRWASEELIVTYVEWLNCDIAKGFPCALVLDVYPSHRTDRVTCTAEANDVELLSFDPSSRTVTQIQPPMEPDESAQQSQRMKSFASLEIKPV